METAKSPATIEAKDNIARFRNLTSFKRDHAANLNKLHDRIKELVGVNDITTSIAAGKGLASTQSEAIAQIEREQNAIRSALKPVDEKIAEMMPEVSAEMHRRSEQLEKLHRECGKILLTFVETTVETALPGWLTPAECKWVALRSAPFRSQAEWEAKHSPNASIGMVQWRHPQTNEMHFVPDEYVMAAPHTVSAILDRLENSIAETTKRLSQLKRDFSA